LPQPAQTHHHPQFQRLCLLLASNLNSLPEILFGFRLRTSDFGLALTCLDLP
jgi:hypothetical protein